MFRLWPLIFLALMIPASADQPKINQLELVCIDTQELIDWLRDEMHEFPLFVATVSKDMKFVITVNHQSKSWTAFMHTDKNACALSGGTGFSLVRLNSI